MIVQGTNQISATSSLLVPPCLALCLNLSIHVTYIRITATCTRHQIHVCTTIAIPSTQRPT